MEQASLIKQQVLEREQTILKKLSGANLNQISAPNVTY